MGDSSAERQEGARKHQLSPGESGLSCLRDRLLIGWVMLQRSGGTIRDSSVINVKGGLNNQGRG